MPKLTFLEIPSRDVAQSAAFYAAVLGWKLDRRPSGDIRFSDDDAHLFGRWRTDREPGRDNVVANYTVADVEAALAPVGELGGEIVSPRTLEGDTWNARVRDPSGNLFGIWQLA